MNTIFEFHSKRRRSIDDFEPIFEERPQTYEQKLAIYTGESCPYCKSKKCYEEIEFISCRSCGHVIERPFDNAAEYRYFSNEDRGSDPTRVGAPQDFHLPNASLGTVILNNYKTNRNMYRICKYHTWNTIPYNERSLIQIYERLSLVGLNNGINQSILEAVKGLYISLNDGTRHGIGRDAILSACLFLALKNSGTPRKPKDVAAIFGIQSPMFTRALKQVQESLSMARQKGRIKGAYNTNKTSTRASEYIQLPVSHLPIQRSQMETIERLAQIIAEKSENENISQENMPPSLAAGCIAFVVKRFKPVKISISQIAAVCNISVATVQKCLNRLELHSAMLEECLK